MNPGNPDKYVCLELGIPSRICISPIKLAHVLISIPPNSKQNVGSHTILTIRISNLGYCV